MLIYVQGHICKFSAIKMGTQPVICTKEKLGAVRNLCAVCINVFYGYEWIEKHEKGCTIHEGDGFP